MEKLLEHSETDPNLTSRCIHEPPIFLTINRVNKIGIELLLKNPKIDLSLKYNGETAYDFAVRKGNTQIVQLIKNAIDTPKPSLSSLSLKQVKPR